MFFIRDPTKFPHFIHVSYTLSLYLPPCLIAIFHRPRSGIRKRIFATTSKQRSFFVVFTPSLLEISSLFWDYLGSNPESLYQVPSLASLLTLDITNGSKVMRLFSDLGTPYGFRHMNGWTGHSYRFDIFSLYDLLLNHPPQMGKGRWKLGVR